jgi:DNA-binding transcriptional regulator YiaG
VTLREYLKHLGVSQAEFAHYIDVPPRTVKRWIAEDKVPRLVQLFINLDPIRVVRNEKEKEA